MLIQWFFSTEVADYREKSAGYHIVYRRKSDYLIQYMYSAILHQLTLTDANKPKENRGNKQKIHLGIII